MALLVNNLGEKVSAEWIFAVQQEISNLLSGVKITKIQWRCPLIFSTYVVIGDRLLTDMSNTLPLPLPLLLNTHLEQGEIESWVFRKGTPAGWKWKNFLKLRMNVCTELKAGSSSLSIPIEELPIFDTRKDRQSVVDVIHNFVYGSYDRGSPIYYPTHQAGLLDKWYTSDDYRTDSCDLEKVFANPNALPVFVSIGRMHNDRAVLYTKYMLESHNPDAAFLFHDWAYFIVLTHRLWKNNAEAKLPYYQFGFI